MKIIKCYLVVLKSENVRYTQIYVGDNESFINDEPDEFLWKDFNGELVLGIFEGKDKDDALRLAAEKNSIPVGNLESYFIGNNEDISKSSTD